MAYQTQPAYIVTCSGWEERIKEHPVFDWMSDHEVAFDFGAAKQEPYTNWFTSDFSFTDPAGNSFKGEEAWAKLLETYAPLSAHFHEPFFGIVFENEKGYELLGCAKIFANLLVTGEGEKRKDLQGREWDVEVPGAFHFTYIKEEGAHKGLRLSEEKLFADGLPMVAALLKRGMVSGEDLVKKLSA